jgi:hypothetical protein
LSYGPKERATGFGPAMSAWKADALPLGDARSNAPNRKRKRVYPSRALSVKQKAAGMLRRRMLFLINSRGQANDFSAASAVWVMSMAMVIGPTPPGTGV